MTLDYDLYTKNSFFGLCCCHWQSISQIYILYLLNSFTRLIKHLHFCLQHTFKSPEILAPAKIPVAAGKNMANTEKKLSPSVY